MRKPALSPTRNLAHYQATVERRRSNAAVPVPSGKRYRRRPKHGRHGE